MEGGRRQALLEAKLRGLARSRIGDAVDRATVAPLPQGAALVAGDHAWVLAEEEAGRALGPALGWSLRRSAAQLHVLAPVSEAGHLARRAALFDRRIEVHGVRGSSLVEVGPASVPPEPPVDPRAFELQPVIERAGAEAVVEHGVLRAEVRGLEVGRVVVDASGTRLEVGVGKHDREAHEEVSGGSHTEARLFETVRQVLEHRVEGGEGHAAYHLATERWLRWVLLQQPALVDASELRPVPSPVPRHDLRRPAPAPAAGVDRAGEAVLVVCSAGVDLDLVPAAADAWQADGRKPRLLLCVPEGDDHRITRDLVGLLTVPAEVVTVDRGWRSR